jgi:regulatory protein
MAGRITAIQVQKKNRHRANIFLDDEFAFGLALIEAAKLSKGQYLSDDDISRLRTADEQARAYEFALDFLSYRPRSSAEVARRLCKKEFCASTIAQVVQRLGRAGLIDDEEFARYWIDNREQFRPRGKRALRYELRRKGISNQVIDNLLQGIDEEENAYRAAAPQLARWQHLDPTTFRRKLTSYLQRRGFNYDVISQVWERIQSEQGPLGLDKREDIDVWDQEP